MAVNIPKWVPEMPTTLAEGPDSPVWEWAERVSCTQIFRGPYAVALAGKVYEGTAGEGDLLGLVCTRSRVEKEKGGRGKLTILWQSPESTAPTGGTVPVDSVRLAPMELNPRVERHSRYASLTDLQREDARAAFEGGSQAVRDDAYGRLPALGQELVGKMRRGTENFYAAGMRYSWTAYYTVLPALTVGGFIEAPGGPLALAIGGLSCLRIADELESEGPYYRVTRNWLAAPSGYWDGDLY